MTRQFPPLRIGVIGCGRVPVYAMLAPARASADAEVVAVAARDLDRAKDYAGQHRVRRAMSYQELVADPMVDLVYIATPPAVHAEQARLAIAHGKPVLVEKPFAMNAAEAATVLAEARAAGVPVFEAMHSRHHAIWGLIAKLTPRLGPIYSIDAVFDTPVRTDAGEFRWDDSLGGGALMDLGVYPLAWARALAGEPLAVRDASFTRERGADAAVTATLTMPNGITARIAADMRAARRARITITGQGGVLIVDNPLAPQLGHHVTHVAGTGSEVFTASGPGSFDAQLAAVVAAVRRTKAFPLPPEDPVASMRAIDMVRAAA